ncbi:serine/threonine protein phosphatase 1 [Rhizobium aethiopicum]|uniref:Serine/threonine protein phosphatase 1 n=1 Tax=Rhizobium aethiopicum TaxID=1138170 RepID=A0A1C3YAY7_9HYPH|nr:metallophosphoesterase [Rhizobium aethiopicum]SCB61633.1 serine/threonine protein phosphatase 1 [Rhizobium aethiopicum]
MFDYLGPWRQLAGNRKKRARLTFAEGDFAAVYAMSDVHGCYTELVEAHRRIVEDAARIPGPKLIVMLGDYVDRGPDSSAVLEFLSKNPPPGFQRLVLCGNHDAELAKLYRKPAGLLEWLGFAGTETLHSYGIDIEHLLQSAGNETITRVIRNMIPERHIQFLESLPIMLRMGRVVFVHAGVRPGIDLKKQKDSDLMWIRQPFLDEGPQLPVLVIHGHTPGRAPTFGPQRIGIDTAVSATGRLTVLTIKGTRVGLL